MKGIFIIRNIQILGEEDVVAVFDDKVLAYSFINRNDTVKGEYTIEEKELNPFFIASKQIPYRVMIHAQDTAKSEVESIKLFDEELSAFHEIVFKIDESFYMCLFADNEREAQAIAFRRYREMVSTGEWMMITDLTDQYEEDD